MGRRDEEVAARREVLLAGRPDPETEDDEQDEPGDQAQEAIQQRGLRLRRPAEPGEPLDRAAPLRSERLR